MRRTTLAALLLAIPACVDSTATEPTADEVADALALEDGGFIYENEAPAFGDTTAYARAEIEASAPVTDAFAADAELLAMERAEGAAARNVLLLWGHLPRNAGEPVRHDWGGTFTLARGGMIIRRQVAFEDATDAVLPRTDRTSISFTSKTGPHVDGLLLTVIDPTPDDANALTLTYAPATGEATTLDLANLVDGPIVVDFADGTQLVAVGRPRRTDCEHGFMRGRWHKIAPNVGVYLGVVGDGEGNPAGHVRGIFGQREGGEPVMFGKFINRDGEVQGLIRGTYADGRFMARWMKREGEHGGLQGAYFSREGAAGDEARGGRFVARWAEAACMEGGGEGGEAPARP